MKLTTITVSYGETQSLPEYSNVKPSITLAAVLSDNDDPTEAEALLWAHAKQSVQEQVDAALEQNDRSAKYSQEPRYQVMQTYHDRYNQPRDYVPPPIVVVILPNAIELDRKRFSVSFVHSGNGDSRKLRYAHAMRIAERVAQEKGTTTILDCSDGDLSRLEAALAASNAAYAPEPENPF